MDTRGSVIERFQRVDAASFGEEIDRLWQAAEKVKETVVAAVEDGNIPPLNGLGMIACVTGQAFAYQQLHGQASPADMLAVLQPRELARTA